jgi:ribosomal protein L7/L12
MMRLVLIALAVIVALQLLARFAARGIPRPESPSEPRPKPSLTPEQRAELEAQRELALREGRQIDAIKIHRQLTGLGLAQAKDEMDEARRQRGRS